MENQLRQSAGSTTRTRSAVVLELEGDTGQHQERHLVDTVAVELAEFVLRFVTEVDGGLHIGQTTGIADCVTEHIVVDDLLERTQRFFVAFQRRSVTANAVFLQVRNQLDNCTRSAFHFLERSDALDNGVGAGAHEARNEHAGAGNLPQGVTPCQPLLQALLGKVGLSHDKNLVNGGVCSTVYAGQCEARLLGRSRAAPCVRIAWLNLQ